MQPITTNCCWIIGSGLSWFTVCVCVFVYTSVSISSHVCLGCLCACVMCLCVRLHNTELGYERFNAATRRGADCRSAGPQTPKHLEVSGPSHYPISPVINHCPVTQQGVSLYVPEACRAIKSPSYFPILHRAA